LSRRIEHVAQFLTQPSGRIMTLNEQLIALVAIAASVAVWTSVFARLRRREEVIPLEPRQPTPWGFVDLLLVVMANILFGMLGHVLMRGVWRIDVPDDVRAIGEQLIPLQLVYIAGTLATLVFSIVLVRLRTKATTADLGLRLDRWRHDLRVGLLGFVALAPPVYALQAALVHFFPTQHPLIDILRERPGTGAVVLVSLSVAVIAPISEEFFLRVLLQGWLERLIATAAPGAFPAPARYSANELPAVESTSASANVAQSANPDAAPQTPPLSAASGTEDVRLARAIPIVTSALVFAFLHVGHGPAPIPLFFLALGLGCLYQRTHRIWAPLAVHCLLNSSSLLMLWLVPA
jgi:membrane protease YdiL (CAAX protease family)